MLTYDQDLVIIAALNVSPPRNAAAITFKSLHSHPAYSLFLWRLLQCIGAGWPWLLILATAKNHLRPNSAGRSSEIIRPHKPGRLLLRRLTLEHGIGILVDCDIAGILSSLGGARPENPGEPLQGFARQSTPK